MLQTSRMDALSGWDVGLPVEGFESPVYPAYPAYIQSILKCPKWNLRLLEEEEDMHICAS